MSTNHQPGPLCQDTHPLRVEDGTGCRMPSPRPGPVGLSGKHAHARRDLSKPTQPELSYNGTQLVWQGHGTFKATSGLPGFQTADNQTTVDHGPIPEGRYSFPLRLGGEAAMVGSGVLDVREGIEHLPAFWTFRGTTFTNAAWGPDRVRLTKERIDHKEARNRDGFYLHDSTKGYSHGCIEVDPRFFQLLRMFVAQHATQHGRTVRLHLRVKYSSATASTYGDTKVP